MIDRAFAEHFAADWIKVWNSHDLTAILKHYAEDVVFHSPRIAIVMDEPTAFVAGKESLARYWGKALSQSKDLRFELDRVYVGRDSLTIAYRNQRGQHVAETFTFNAEGVVKESIATYA